MNSPHNTAQQKEAPPQAPVALKRRFAFKIAFFSRYTKRAKGTLLEVDNEKILHIMFAAVETRVLPDDIVAGSEAVLEVEKSQSVVFEDFTGLA